LPVKIDLNPGDAQAVALRQTLNSKN